MGMWVEGRILSMCHKPYLKRGFPGQNELFFIGDVHIPPFPSSAADVPLAPLGAVCNNYFFMGKCIKPKATLKKGPSLLQGIDLALSSPGSIPLPILFLGFSPCLSSQILENLFVGGKTATNQ